MYKNKIFILKKGQNKFVNKLFRQQKGDVIIINNLINLFNWKQKSKFEKISKT